MQPHELLIFRRYLSEIHPKIHPITHSPGRDMECLLWAQTSSTFCQCNCGLICNYHAILQIVMPRVHGIYQPIVHVHRKVYIQCIYVTIPRTKLSQFSCVTPIYPIWNITLYNRCKSIFMDIISITCNGQNQNDNHSCRPKTGPMMAPWTWLSGTTLFVIGREVSVSQ